MSRVLAYMGAAIFQAISQTWNRLDFALHAIAFAPKADLHGRLADCSRDGFLDAMDVSCHSFIRMARLAEPPPPNMAALPPCGSGARRSMILIPVSNMAVV